MNKLKHKLLGTLMLLVSLTLFSSLTTTAQAANSILEIGEIRSLSTEVDVPIMLHNTSYVESAFLEFSLPADAKGVSITGIELTPLFTNEPFSTTTKLLSDSKATIDILSTTNKAIKIPKDVAIIGYIKLKLSSDFKDGQSISIETTDTKVIGSSDKEITLTLISGEISKRMTIGDVVGKNEVTAAGAMRVLQHANGTKLITNAEEQVSADVNLDGRITQEDAIYILDYVSGKKLSFLAIEEKSLANAIKGSDYQIQIVAKYGREPYEFKKKGSFPSGLKLDSTTGEITGKPSTAKEYTFTVEVTDAVGHEAERQFTINVIDSNIKSVEQLNPVYVNKGGTPNLPSTVKVTFNDKTTDNVKVQWDVSTLDTSKLGKTTLKGTVGDTGYTIYVDVNVIDHSYIQGIEVGYFDQLTLHTIEIDSTKDVYAITINGINAHYEGNNQFSLMSSSFAKGSSVTLKLFDKYGNLLETKTHKLEITKQFGG